MGIVIYLKGLSVGLREDPIIGESLGVGVEERQPPFDLLQLEKGQRGQRSPLVPHADAPHEPAHVLPHPPHVLVQAGKKR
jgi:hypothetical protein